MSNCNCIKTTNEMMQEQEKRIAFYERMWEDCKEYPELKKLAEWKLSVCLDILNELGMRKSLL